MENSNESSTPESLKSEKSTPPEAPKKAPAPARFHLQEAIRSARNLLPEFKKAARSEKDQKEGGR